MTVRVRFAPSPTGHLHIGGARTALYNWLFARHAGGKFILRIEDTDTERSTDEYIDSILEGMRWLGLEWDEGPFHQMERIEIYQQHAEKLLKEEKAYRCYCTSEELESKRERALKEGRKPKYDGTCRRLPANHVSDKPFVLRLKAPESGTTLVKDVIRGEIPFENKELDDLIIMRSNNTPTYNFTVVVDDVTMAISHVIRGDDHLNNTPRQILLYQAFDYPVPLFVHLPMILGADKKRLSKRHGATSVLAYREMGYLPEALLNYLVRLGWSSGDQEIFSMPELIEKFSLSVIGSSPSVFNPEKLDWVNAQHLKKYSDEELAEMVVPYIEKLALRAANIDYAAKAIATERERAKTFVELASVSAFYFRKEIEIDMEAAKKWIDSTSLAALQKVCEEIQQLDSFDEESLKALFHSIMEKYALKMVKLAQPCRLALTGTTVSPGIYEVMLILGKEESLKRLQAAVSKFSSV